MTTKLIIAALLATAAYGQGLPAETGAEVTVSEKQGIVYSSAPLPSFIDEPFQWTVNDPRLSKILFRISESSPRVITIILDAPRLRITTEGHESILYEIEPYYDSDGRLALRLLPINRPTDQPINGPTDQPPNRP